jgi:hypothetical protein
MDDSSARRRDRWPAGRWWKWGLGLIALGLLFAVYSQRSGAERRALLRLPESERREILARELETFLALCGGDRDAGGLAGVCRERAGFIRGFPECDEACRRTIGRYLPTPTR